MKIEFLNVYWLLLLPVLLGAILYISKKGSFSSGFRQSLYTTIRSMVCILLVVAMAMPQWVTASERTTTMVLLDRSASVENMEVENFLKELNDAKGEKDDLGLILFGQEPSVEKVPSIQGESIPEKGFLSVIEEGGTHIESALTLANSLFPKDSGKRIVLISDGVETLGDAVLKSDILNTQGVSIDVVPLQPEIGEEVQLTSLKIPPLIHKNTEYPIEIQVDSNVKTEAKIRLYKENTFIKEEDVMIETGQNRIVFSDITETGGAIVYQGEIITSKDTLKENNSVYGYTYIDDIPQILVVGNEKESLGWKQLLESSRLGVTIVHPSAVPTRIETLQKYHGIILANVAKEEMADLFLTSLESYVRVLGGGLIVTGGDNAYGLGGYKDTILEEILPVTMEVKTQGEESSLAMVMVIDRSGSMDSGEFGISPMEMAKEAVIGSLDGFKNKDILGVIGFDSSFQWAVPMTVVGGNKDGIIDAISGIQASGGTSILPGLIEAVRTLESTQAKEKHIILLTDGQAEQKGYTPVLEQINREGITLSTVAVGSQSDMKLLGNLAEEGHGRYYYTDAFVDLPQIFAKETLLAGKEYMNQEPFYPQQGDASSILAEISSVPKLGGYVGTMEKARADVVLRSPKEEPILSTWQYGLGRSVAWTSDVGGSWTQEWLSSGEGVAILQNTVGWVLNSQLPQEIKLSAQGLGKESKITIEMPYDETIETLVGTVLYGEGESAQVNFSMKSPGIYEGILPMAKEGAYSTSIQIQKKDGQEEYYNTGFVLPYAKEYDVMNEGKSVLDEIIASVDGRSLTSGAEVFEKEVAGVSATKDMTLLCLWLALVVFIIDIALRRFSFLTLKLETFILKFTKDIVSKKGNRTNLKEEKIQEKTIKQEKEKQSIEKSAQEPVEKMEVKTTAQKLAEIKKNRNR